MRVAVFDTNILISALLWPRGKPFECLNLARDGKAGSVTCEEILEEFKRKRVIKFNMTADRASEAAGEVRRISAVVTIGGKTRGAPDPDDNKVLECAVVGKATHVVTGDRRHLLSLKAFQGVAIMTAAEFLNIFDEEEPGNTRDS